MKLSDKGRIERMNKFKTKTVVIKEEEKRYQRKQRSTGNWFSVESGC